MAGEDKIRALRRGRREITQDEPCTFSFSEDIVRIEIGQDGSDQKLIFYTDPKNTLIKCRVFSRLEIHLLARIAWLPLSARVNLDVIYDVQTKKFIRLHMGGPALPSRQPGNLLNAWRQKKIDQWSQLLAPGIDYGSRFLEEIGDPDLSDPKDAIEGVLVSFASFRDPVSRQPGNKHWTPVLECLAELKKKSHLTAFGTRFEISEDERTIRLVQVPKALVDGQVEPTLDARTWIVGVMGAPYVWGRSVWNDLLGEQVKASELDFQHGSLFTPLLLEAAGSNSHLDWNLVYEKTENIAPGLFGRPATLRSMQLSSRIDNKGVKVNFPLLRNHLSSPIEAEIIPPYLFLSDREIGTREQMAVRLEWIVDTVFRPGLSLTLKKDVHLKLPENAVNRSVRIGALDITFAHKPLARRSQTQPELRWDFIPSQHPDPDGLYQPREAFIEIDWAVEAISPGGQDDLTGELSTDCDKNSLNALREPERAERALECDFQRERPLVIPLHQRPAAQGDPPLILNVSERARLRDLRRIDLVLRRTDGAGDPGDELKELEVCFPENEKKMDRVAVLDREPFLVAKVSFPALGSLENAAAGNEFANWQSYGSDAGTWHIRFPNAQNFCLTLPPQGVGETMEKRKEHKQGLPEGDLADFRLSPPAFLAMRERYYRQNFPEAPWNLRRLLSDPERELPGAHLEHLQYELLYGLSCRIDYPFMRLAEISALVGDVIGPLPRNPAWVPFKDAKVDGEAQGDYLQARRRWASLAQRTRQRLGIFELWDIRKLDTLELKEDVTCWIRQMPGDHQLTDDPTEEPGDDKKRPKTLPDGLVKVRKADLANPVPLDPDAPDPGLKGGATWGFESRNIYQAVLRPHDEKWPRSSGAAMKDTRLSALGGYGHQMAAFDNWRTKILADVSMGRTWSYTLERIGRIGVCWNRCKHVIVYERTVVRSPLFGPTEDGKPDGQNKHEGRAVLRKVDEFVEVLQNSRRYPDQGKGDAKATGFVTECSFSEDPNQVVRFRVRGSWGTDVGNVGWKIPIWRPGEEPAELFPKPVVHFTVMASVDGESVPRKVAIANPENLYFYTDTTVPPEALDNPSVDLSNTDAWTPVEGVDFVDQARPAAAGDNAFASGSLKQTSAGDTVMPIGFGPCTFLIEPAEHTVDLLAHRKGDPMGALLSSVTMCRADLGEKLSDFSKVLATAQTKVGELIEAGIAALPADPRRFDPADVKGAFQKLCASVKGEVNKALAGPRAQSEDASKRIKSAEELVKDLNQQAIESIAKGSQKILRFPTELAVSFETDKEKLAEALKLEVAKMLGQVSLLPSLTAYLSDVQGALQILRSSIASARDEVKGIVKPGLETWLGDPDLLRLPELLQRLRSYRAKLQAVSRKVRELTEKSSTLDQGGTPVPVGLGPRWAQVKLGLAALAESLKKADSMLATAENLLATAKERRQKLKELLAERLKNLDQQAKSLDEKIVEADNSLKTLRDKIKLAEEGRLGAVKLFADKALERAVQAIGTGPGSVNLPAVQAAWENAVKDEVDELRKRLTETLTTLHGGAAEFFVGLKDVESVIPTPKEVEDEIQARCEAIEKGFDALLTEIKDKLDIDHQVAEVRRLLERYRDDAVQELEARFGGGIKAARQVLGVVESKKDDVLKLVRAFGTPPDVSGLKFDRPEVAFFYNELKDRVNVTPVIARAAQAAAIVDALKPFGVDLPVKELGEQLIPAELRNFDVSSILPNIAGIPLKDLFSGLKMPAGSGDAVKVRHGLDPQTRRAWVNTEINFQASENATLFAVGPLAVRVNQPTFKAQARMEADQQGIRQRQVSGELRGDWLLQIGGFPLITFRQTPLTFDEDGRINFKVNPQDVQLAPALDFINDLMSAISPGGLTTRFDGDGVVSTLDLPIPDTQVGAFGFSGLKLCASMALRYGSGDFNIGVTAGLARRDAPFTLTVFILGGAGYLELGSRYHPSTGKVYATADMAIAVSASLGIALGPIRGSVAVYLGVTANYDSARGGGLVVGLMFMIRGHVSVLSIASATITLRLDGQYQGGAMVGTGHLEIKIKICWCFTLEVSESVKYTLGRVGSNQRASLGGPRPVAQLASLNGMAALGMEEEPVKIDKINPEKLKAAVENYLDMLV